MCCYVHCCMCYIHCDTYRYLVNMLYIHIHTLMDIYRYFFISFIHMYIQWLGHYSLLPPFITIYFVLWTENVCLPKIRYWELILGETWKHTPPAPNMWLVPNAKVKRHYMSSLAMRTQKENAAIRESGAGSSPNSEMLAPEIRLLVS
jgi:hypothetical protein